jgi:hypothetical protein
MEVAMSNAAVLQRVNHQAQAAILKMKREAAELRAKEEAGVVTSITILQGVNRTRLASLMAPLPYSVEADPIPMPDAFTGFPVLEVKAARITTPSADHYQGAMVNPEADEESTLRYLAATAADHGRVELWGIRGAEGQHGDRYVWATPAALWSHYPDAVTRERRSLAGVHAPALTHILAQRFGVFAREQHA